MHIWSGRVNATLKKGLAYVFECKPHFIPKCFRKQEVVCCLGLTEGHVCKKAENKIKREKERKKGTKEEYIVKVVVIAVVVVVVVGIYMKSEMRTTKGNNNKAYLNRNDYD